MKLKLDEKYWKISKYVILTVALIYLAYCCMNFLFSVIGDVSGTLNAINIFFNKVSAVFAPVILAFVFAYLFDPLVDKLDKLYHKYKKNKSPKKITKDKTMDEGKFKQRTAGTAIFYILFIGVLATIITLIVSNFSINKSADESFSKYVTDIMSYMVEKYNQTYDDIVKKLTDLNLINYFRGFLKAIYTFVSKSGNGFTKVIGSIGNGIFTFSLALVMCFYVLRDKEAFKFKTINLMDTFIPDKANGIIKTFFSEVNNIFSGYIRGQLTDAAIIATLLSISLTIVGVPFGAIIGLVAGCCNVIPYVGAIIAFVFATISGLLSGNPIIALYAIIVIFAIQQLDASFIVPKVVGKSIELSPFLVLVALAVGGTMFGVFGMIFALPVTATLKILVIKFIEYQKKSAGIKKALTIHRNK